LLIPYMHTVYFEQVQPFHYTLIPSTFFTQCLVALIMMCSNRHIAYFNPLPPQCPFPSPSHWSPPYHPISRSWPIIIVITTIILGLSSTNEQEHKIFSFNPGSSHSTE
jgi:hypothetical protein